jgi:exodeoxyribonuclease-3
VLLIGDYNVVATDGKGDIYNAASWKKDALLQPQAARPTGACSPRGGPTPSMRCTKASRSTPSGTISATASRDAGLRIDHLLLNAPARSRLREAGVDRAVRGRGKAERPRADLGRARLSRRAPCAGFRRHCGPWL